ncbi:S49 family peptidase [uncultured Rhodospira sp.]|uniref:S49 family peptidase n=1 Tax=uncultured Rhodospira sp. TaxID=1936189 RepID=UPI002620D61C|nr:S49 family peptidase [uncultured Rhodospira sp.]
MFRFLGKMIVWLLAVVGVFAVIMVGAAALIVPRLVQKPDPLPDGMILMVDLDQDIAEGDEPISWLPGEGGDGMTLRTLLDGLERAAADDRVKGLVARVRSPAMGIAQAQEVREAVHAFRANGKPTYVFADTMPAAGGGTLAYYLASAFGEIWMQPSGEVGLTGVAMELPFAAEALSTLGVTFESSARHEYKGVLAALSEESIPAPVAENMGRLVVSWFDQIQAGISAARELSLEDLGSAIDRAPLLVDEAVDAGLVDTAGYIDEFREALAEAVGDHPRLSVADYMARRDDPESENARRIALVHGIGMVLPGGGEDGPGFGGGTALRADDLAAAVRSAVEDERVAAIVLRLDSPGGDYVAADTARRAVAHARERGTPVIVSMGNTVASGGYFIALEGDRILASAGTITGSIGVAAGKPVARELWDDIGVDWARLAEGRNAAMWSLNTPFSLAAQRALDKRLDAIYADFTARVGAARDLDGARLDRAARGRVFTGADAVDLGLVDRIGGLRDALRDAREAAALPPDEPVVVAPYPAPLDPLDRLMRLLESRGVPGLANALAGLTDDDLRTLAHLIGLVRPLVTSLDGLAPPPSAEPGLLYRGPTRPSGAP